MFAARGWQCEDFDVVNGPEQDLTRDDLWTSLLVRIKCKCFRFIVMGPPCSTFSRARTRQPGPRPLRSAEAPYGLPREQLTEAERKELAHGNFFVLMAAAAFRTAVAAQVPVVLENPQPVPGHASAFQLDEWRELAATPGVHTIDFDQCRLGAETAKPTRLLAWGVDLSAIHKQRCDHPYRCWAWADLEGRPRRHWGPHPPLAGRRRSNGDFATKAAAAYPTDFNKFLVDAALAPAEGPRALPPAPLPPAATVEDPLGIGHAPGGQSA